MTKYEYKNLREAKQSQLNKWGREGWKVISAEFVHKRWDEAEEIHRSGWNCLMIREIISDSGEI